MHRILISLLYLLLPVCLCAQTPRLKSGCWQNEARRPFNCYADSFQVAIVSIAQNDKLYFEGRWRAANQIEGQLLHVDFRTQKQTKTRAVLAKQAADRLEIVAGGVPGSDFSAGKTLLFSGATRYVPVKGPIFDKKHEAWERNVWFQFADTIVQIFVLIDLAHYEKTVIHSDGTAKGIRYRLFPDGCQNREQVQYALQKNGDIIFRLVRMDQACDAFKGQTSLGTVKTSFADHGFICPNTGPRFLPIPELRRRGLVGWWPADGHSTDIATGATGTLYNSAGYGPGHSGLAFSLDGVSDYIDIPHRPEHQPLRITVMAWIKGRPTKQDLQYLLVDTQHGFGDNTGWLMQGGNRDGILGFGYGIKGRREEFQVVNGKTDVLDNRWHHVAGTFDGTHFHWYMDGKLDATDVAKGPPAPSNRGLRIGCTRSFTRHFWGLVDDLAIFNRALSAEEIQRVYVGGMPALLESEAQFVAPENNTPSVKPLPSRFSVAEVLVNNRPVAIDTGVGAGRPLVLKPPVMSLSIRLKNESQNFGHYSLVGLDSVWRLLTPDYTITLSGLPAGDYILRVAPSLSGMTDEQEETLEVPIRVEGTQGLAWWWLAGLPVLLAALYWYWRRENHRQHREREQLHRRLSRDLHDDLGASLSSIALSSRLAAEQETPENLRNTLDRISDEARQAGSLANDLVWSVNPGADSMDELLARIRLFAAELFEDSDITLLFDIAPDLSELPLDSEARRHLYLIVKEALNNAAKYAQATSVHVGMHLSGKNLTLEVRDDGLGFDPATVRRGNGLNNLAARAELLGAKLTVKSQPEQGTSVVLECPIR